MEFVERLARSRSGDPSASAELFDRWRPLLVLQARGLLGARFAAQLDPSDVVQEALTQASQSLPQFQGKTEAEWLGWLQCLVTGHAAKAHRHHRAAKRDIGRGEPLGPGAPGPASPNVSPLSDVIDREQALRLAAAIEQLPDRMREVVLRRVLDQQPFAEIAQTLGCQAGAARVLWTRAIRRLREMID